MGAIFTYLAGSLPLMITVSVLTGIGLIALGVGIYKIAKKN